MLQSVSSLLYISDTIPGANPIPASPALLIRELRIRAKYKALFLLSKIPILG